MVVSDLLAYLFTFVCIVVFSDILGTVDLYIDKFGIQPQISGAFIGATTLGAAVSGLPIACLARRLNIKTLMMICSALGSLFSIIYGCGYVGQSVAPILIARILLGLFVTSPQLSGMYIGKKYSGTNAIRAVSVFNAITCLGYAAGPLVSAVLMYIFGNVTNDVLNAKTANGWFDCLLCATFCACVAMFMIEPKRRTDSTQPSLKADFPSYSINVLLTCTQSIPYTLWFVNTAVLNDWFNWSRQARLFYVSGLAFVGAPVQLCTTLRTPPFRSLILWSSVAFLGSILLIPFADDETTRFVLYTIGSLIFNPTNMIIHALNFSLAKPLAVKPKDILASVDFIVYVIGVSTGSIFVFFMTERYTIGVTICAFSFVNVVLSTLLTLCYMRHTRVIFRLASINSFECVTGFNIFGI